MDESNSLKPAIGLENSTDPESLAPAPLSRRAAPPSAGDGGDSTVAGSTSSPGPTARAAERLLAELPLPAAEVGPTESYTIKLDAFEGPLDLLLYLIRREEINIWDIPIAHITAQYLEYIQAMRDLNINVAGEFLVMAATLIHIKSKMLLPPDPSPAEDGATEEEDPRHELVYQLLEHEKFKNAAQMLYAKESVESEVWSVPPREFLEEGGELIAATLFDLVRAYRDAVQRFAERITLEYHREEITVEEKIAEIRHRLLVQNRLVFSSLFGPTALRRILVVTFLAVLELTRLGEIELWQDRVLSEIFLQKSARAPQALVFDEATV